MKTRTIYRIISVIFIFFALGHTVGFTTFRPSTAEGMAVLDGMNNVHFDRGGQTFSYGGFYMGFGLSLSISMLFSAFLSWQMDKLNSPAVAWAFFAMQLPNLILAWLYFGIPPLVFSTVVTVLLGYGAYRVSQNGIAA